LSVTPPFSTSRPGEAESKSATIGFSNRLSSFDLSTVSPLAGEES
jgi:hypothetical protein